MNNLGLSAEAVKEAGERAMAGTYYSPLDEVFRVQKSVPFAGAYKKLEGWRATGKKQQSNQAVFPTPSNAHYRQLLSGIGLAKPHHSRGSRGSGSQGSEGESQRPPSKYVRDGPERSGDEKFTLFGADDGEDAHLVPDSPECSPPYDAHLVPGSPECSPPYGPSLQAVIGISIEDLPLSVLEKAAGNVQNILDKKQKDISLPNDEDWENCSANAAAKKKYVATILQYIARDAKPAVRDIHINKLRLASSHRKCFDVNPTLLVIPVCPKKDICNWKPETPYSVIFIASRAGTYVNQVPGLTILQAPTNCHVDRAFATPEDLHVAASHLSDMVKALAEQASSGHRDGAVVDPIDLAQTDEQRHKMRTLASVLQNGTVDAPILRDPFAQILKVTFVRDNPVYGIPDPLMLLEKASINWYYVKGDVIDGTPVKLKLLPTCGPPFDPEKAELEELSYQLHQELEEEQAVEDREAQSRADLAAGLHQTENLTAAVDEDGPTPTLAEWVSNSLRYPEESTALDDATNK